MFDTYVTNIQSNIHLVKVERIARTNNFLQVFQLLSVSGENNFTIIKKDNTQ